MKIEVNITKKYFLIILGIMFLLTGGLVYAYGGNNPVVAGHSASEIDGLMEEVFQGGALMYFGNTGTIFKEGVSATAIATYTCSTRTCSAIGEARINSGVIQTRVQRTGSRYSSSNCDSGWVNGMSASCLGAVATTTGNGVEVVAGSYADSGAWN